MAFVPIPTRVKSNTKIMEMINDEVSKNKLKSIKLISRTLDTFSIINQLNLGKNPDFEMKIIAPNLMSDSSVRRKGEYKSKLVNLATGHKENTLKWRKGDFNSFKLFIINDEVLLLTVNSGDNKRKSSLYSNDTYAVQHFVQIFNGFFELAQEPSIKEIEKILLLTKDQEIKS